MRLLITGGAGFLGARLARELLASPQLAWGGDEPCGLTELWLTDQVPPPADLCEDPRVRVLSGDLLDLLDSGTLSLRGKDAVVHLAAAVSGDCERDLDLGLRSNIDTTRALLQAARAAGHAPLFVYASSVAVFGGEPGQPLPALIRDDTLPVPQGSYGVQKFIGEQLVADYGRRGLVRARTLRLMTVAIRPGRPNGAASGFLSGMVREPLAGLRASVPVPPHTAVALASPGNTIAGLLAALTCSHRDWGPRTALNLPALSTTVGEIAGALGRLAGPAALALLDWVPDARIGAIVSAWPSRFDTARAHALGLSPDASVDELLAQYVRENRSAVQWP
ncbi:NAD-dependent epimerase/dehydratase family protein [Ideonella sp. 4Y16]|uniref:NAD-dependent epimerase/dehydratase family protein n=1 Tax=Ideonella alba TaxID=2824118 RepID=A0A941BM27_9BURK|nr:D-erythronate dehydrogenase [Ideonella alba]MBQ0931819.1 NAD-dependent epimerase/dehydratase family protein [Ideonella alba]MBQ0941738.1 NAD-dependent epimerase/dehydratase family protein [Ideonella alba]